MADFQLILESDPVPEQIQYLDDRLYEFNVKATGISDGRGLSIMVHDDHGKGLY